ARPNSRLIQYACWWKPRPTVERDQFDLLALSPFAATDQLEPLLGSFAPKETIKEVIQESAKESAKGPAKGPAKGSAKQSATPPVKAATKWRPAWQFAELLRLPHYKRLSPQRAQDRTDDLVEQGARRVGTKPPGAAMRVQLPPARQVAFPQAYVSAREAIDL